MKTHKVHIGSGEFKGRTIELPDCEGTRPTKSIVRQSVINTLRDDLPFCRFVEVFAGSGSVGFEVIFMEQNSSVAKVLQNNLKSLQTTKGRVVLGDSFETIYNVQKDLCVKSENIIFYFDPPFHIREGQADIYQKTLNAIELLPKEKVKYVVIEHLSTYVQPASIGPFIQKKTKRFGKTSLSYFEPA